MELLSIVLISLPLIALILLANVIAQRRTGRVYFDILLLLVHLGVIVLGLLLFAASLLPDELVADAPIEIGGLAITVILVGFWGVLVSIQPFRRLLSRLLPIDPLSSVHTLALVFASYLVANTVMTLQLGGLENLVDTVESASVGLFVVQQALFAFVALLGVGLFIRRSLPELLDRMGLVRPTWRQIAIGTGWIAVLVVAQAIAGGLWATANPEEAELVESVNSLLLADIDTVWEWFLLALAAGVGEELLFRGALQPIFGIWVTAALFAVSHIQYGFSPVILILVFIAVVLGFIRRRYNTTTAVYVHFGYDFVLGLVALLAVYLEPLIEQYAFLF